MLREAEPEMPSAVAAFCLLLLTGCRLSEIQTLRWEHVREDCIELRDGKTGGRVVPLGPEARDLLAALPRDDDNPWVIAGRLKGSHLTDLQHPWRRIRKRAGLEDVRIHDLSPHPRGREGFVTTVTGGCIRGAAGPEVGWPGSWKPSDQWRARAPVYKPGSTLFGFVADGAGVPVTSFERLKVAVRVLPRPP